MKVRFKLYHKIKYTQFYNIEGNSKSFLLKFGKSKGYLKSNERNFDSVKIAPLSLESRKMP